MNVSTTWTTAAEWTSTAEPDSSSALELKTSVHLVLAIVGAVLMAGLYSFGCHQCCVGNTTQRHKPLHRCLTVTFMQFAAVADILLPVHYIKGKNGRGMVAAIRWLIACAILFATVVLFQFAMDTVNSLYRNNVLVRTTSLDAGSEEDKKELDRAPKWFYKFWKYSTFTNLFFLALAWPISFALKSQSSFPIWLYYCFQNALVALASVTVAIALLQVRYRALRIVKAGASRRRAVSSSTRLRSPSSGRRVASPMSFTRSHSSHYNFVDLQREMYKLNFVIVATVLIGGSGMYALGSALWNVSADKVRGGSVWQSPYPTVTDYCIHILWDLALSSVLISWNYSHRSCMATYGFCSDEPLEPWQKPKDERAEKYEKRITENSFWFIWFPQLMPEYMRKEYETQTRRTRFDQSPHSLFKALASELMTVDLSGGRKDKIQDIESDASKPSIERTPPNLGTHFTHEFQDPRRRPEVVHSAEMDILSALSLGRMPPPKRVTVTKLSADSRKSKSSHSLSSEKPLKVCVIAAERVFMDLRPDIWAYLDNDGRYFFHESHSQKKRWELTKDMFGGRRKLFALQKFLVCNKGISAKFVVVGSRMRTDLLRVLLAYGGCLEGVEVHGSDVWDGLQPADLGRDWGVDLKEVVHSRKEGLHNLLLKIMKTKRIGNDEMLFVDTSANVLQQLDSINLCRTFKVQQLGNISYTEIDNLMIELMVV